MKYLVTGANGQLGNGLRKILPESEAVFTDVAELDVTDREAILGMLEKEKPEYVLHCAALTNVDGCEDNPELADKINHKSTEYFAEGCNKVNATLMYISTDYVFDGTAKEPYKVDDKPNPQSAYGKTKLLGEEAAKKAKKCYIIRTAWVYGDGHNFVKTMLRLSETMPEIKVVNDQIGKPAWADDLAKAMIGVIEKNLPQGVYHFTNDGDEISWADFARKIFELAGKGTTVPNITTEEYIAMNSNKKIAPRPHYSVLDLSKLKNAGVSVPNWEESLKSYLELG
ncbi:TPA: dTDP-4-dehydrorhamnose reductase [candidate division CPR2 bacterium]|uniref:dTDP-4-dehydrorhamnose reductase n=1 Tax=candidate division CPR2 bacterium GW2011_GWC1_41_48 TaxID=1618344 RepID=A0A0G0YGI4_UNCC2|nr:MAG: hypothetical protein UT47_C0007G0010 [candidate division CPR2 bacterium GW2011_GWC2_39_35]KKR28757.1 MAG: hypothetical protein UT60_C0013G0024 [candidate division CPR2 bacterium GW2011_GWD2_39_7]KKS08656.1 MAG: hypothetical protein UU65_C0006G0026 [candidate division CPR2 bacterium GW2011_GWC1_41_48]OGB73146.1 MAG: dTDP-4-dehydrorhamnose reductase [candidate division CPR2 bacterium GWD2_39_7]HBG81394.1 dTDP-4-dehydrorhamnose reductase [candidate division CPR2 bacterium]